MNLDDIRRHLEEDREWWSRGSPSGKVEPPEFRHRVNGAFSRFGRSIQERSMLLKELEKAR